MMHEKFMFKLWLTLFCVCNGLYMRFANENPERTPRITLSSFQTSSVELHIKCIKYAYIFYVNAGLQMAMLNCRFIRSPEVTKCFVYNYVAIQTKWWMVKWTKIESPIIIIINSLNCFCFDVVNRVNKWFQLNSIFQVINYFRK